MGSVSGGKVLKRASIDSARFRYQPGYGPLVPNPAATFMECVTLLCFRKPVKPTATIIDPRQE